MLKSGSHLSRQKNISPRSSNRAWNVSIGEDESMRTASPLFFVSRPHALHDYFREPAPSYRCWHDPASPDRRCEPRTGTRSTDIGPMPFAQTRQANKTCAHAEVRFTHATLSDPVSDLEACSRNDGQTGNYRSKDENGRSRRCRQEISRYETFSFQQLMIMRTAPGCCC